MIFIVKDEHDKSRDIVSIVKKNHLKLSLCIIMLQTLAKHIMGVHMNAGQITQDPKEGELSLEFIKKYIHYCKR